MIRASLVTIVVLAGCLSLALAEQGPEVTGGPAKALSDKLLTPVTISFKDAALVDVLRILADKGDLNIIANQEVQGTVTTQAADVPLGEILNTILDINGYGYVKTEHLVKIVPLSKLGGDQIETDTRIFRLSYADIDEVGKAVKEMVSQFGRAQYDRRSNQIVVTDTPGNLDRIEKILTQLDRRTPQVMIEVRIVDITLGDEFAMGINWQVLNTKETDSDGLPRKVIGLTTVDATKFAGMIRFGELNGNTDITSFLQLLETEDRATLLATPRILTLDNEEASIEMIQEIPYQELTETDAGGQIGTTDFKEVGVKLVVTPHVTFDQKVILKVNPSFSVLTGFTPESDQPIIDRRETKTTMMVDDNATVVIGGLRRNSKTETIQKIPILGDIPLLKYFFRSRETTNDDTELVVFVTPHITTMPVLNEHEARVLGCTEVPEIDAPCLSE